ncbi:solute carrier family 35 member F5 [Anarrhichthys ocellatus]|uniref:solute carrier family 35 member F5 n=1 Tax=Anarrhichthys ocellatus TaxID=433405 RepID=UPI0012EDCC34|nr:solute carrier family 35 member F5 [Anarrhichthys ocellatus]
MEWVFIMNRMSSQGSSAAQRRRMALGVAILLLVDVIWVASSELTSYIFKRQEYNKPFFSTFTKTSMFVLYLLGFLLWRPWRQQCTGTLKRRHSAFIAWTQSVHVVSLLFSMGGVALVSFSSMDNPDENGVTGSLWSLAGAVLYAVYIVMIKRRVDREDKLDIPMFFGFVGLFNLLLLWPGFLLLHYTGFEAFELPSQLVWTYILINGLIGTVLSEFLWLWGCFLTSSLIGTMALSLTIPLSIMADICMHKVRFSWLFFAGAVPVFLSFFIAALLCHYNNWDPVLVGLRRVYVFICRKHRIQRLPEDSEQCESLIPLHPFSPNEASFCS